MSVDAKDTKLILELATYAAKAVTKEATSEIFDRVNALHDRQIARIDSAVSLLADTNAKLSAVAERVSVVSDSMAELVDGDAVRGIAREIVDGCARTHKSDMAQRVKREADKKSMLIALSALGVTVSDKLWPWVSRVINGG